MENDGRFPMQKLDAYQIALELARRVHETKIRDGELADQAARVSQERVPQSRGTLPGRGPRGGPPPRPSPRSGGGG